MQVSDMRALRTLYAHKHLRILRSQKPPSFPTLISSKSFPPNPKFSLQRTLYSTPHLLCNESTSSNSWATLNSPRTESKSSVNTVYDPVSGSLVTSRGSKRNNNDGESELSNGDEDVSKRSHGDVRRGNLGGGSEKRLGFGEILVNKKKGKSKEQWVCSDCGHSDGQWWGSCRACNSVGTVKKFTEVESDGGKGSGFEVSNNVVKSWLPTLSGEVVPMRLTDVNRGINQLNWRIPLSGLFGSEVARVLGGGLVPGCLVLVGGDPGVGKSTLLLQIAAIIAEGRDFGAPTPVVYVSGEESVEQIGNRADRLRIGTEELFLYSIYLKGVTGSPGGIFQVKECTSALLRFAKKTNIPVLLRNAEATVRRQTYNPVVLKSPRVEIAPITHGAPERMLLAVPKVEPAKSWKDALLSPITQGAPEQKLLAVPKVTGVTKKVTLLQKVESLRKITEDYVKASKQYATVRAIAQTKSFLIQ
ncbi:unnamed protein product [Camellia sinensis]